MIRKYAFSYSSVVTWLLVTACGSDVEISKKAVSLETADGEAVENPLDDAPLRHILSEQGLPKDGLVPVLEQVDGPNGRYSLFIASRADAEGAKATVTQGYEELKVREALPEELRSSEE